MAPCIMQTYCTLPDDEWVKSIFLSKKTIVYNSFDKKKTHKPEYIDMLVYVYIYSTEHTSIS